jgi:hypothetical protein
MVQNNCVNCGYPFHNFQQSTLVLCACPRCGHKIDPPIKFDRPNESTTDDSTKQYQSIIEDAVHDNE